VATGGGTSETTIYVAGLFEKVTRTSQPTEYRHTIRGGNGAAAIHIRRSNGTSDTYYLHQDHLGSPELITGNGGSVVVRTSFSAYGERRDGADWSGAPPGSDLIAISNSSRRGFTGHEHLDNVGLIHMNGRVYDPRIGRFLGADPIVVAGHSQGINPYAYVWNEPLRLTDPSGFCPEAGVDCGPATIGGGRIWSPWPADVYFTGVFRSWPWYTPSASPASAPYESPGTVLPKEGRATFTGLQPAYRDVVFVPTERDDTYPYDVYVVDEGWLIIAGPFPGSILPDQTRISCSPGERCPWIADGRYRYRHWKSPGGWRRHPNHALRRALVLGTVPTAVPNKSDSAKKGGYEGQRKATEIMVHPGSKNSTSSEGCLTVVSNNYEPFIGAVPEGASGSVEVIPVGQQSSRPPYSPNPGTEALPRSCPTR
jgi:RHS repeat-associated protein